MNISMMYQLVAECRTMDKTYEPPDVQVLGTLADVTKAGPINYLSGKADGLYLGSVNDPLYSR